MLGAGARQRPQVRQTIESHIHFSGRAAKLVTLDVLDKIFRQVLWADHLHERQTRIDAGRNYVSINFIAVCQDDATGFAVFQDDFFDGRLGANLRTSLARGVANRIRDGARASARQSP